MILKFGMCKLMAVLMMMNAHAGERLYTMADFEILRTGLPQDKGMMPDSGLLVFEGASVISLPDGNCCFMHHLVKIGKSIKLTEASSLRMLTYLRDKDVHMRVLAYLSVSEYLRESGVPDHGGNAFALVHASRTPVGPLAKYQKLIKKNEEEAINKLLGSYLRLLKKKELK